MPRLCSSLLLSLLIASSASAATMDWAPVGNPGNAPDFTGYGAVEYVYSIGTYEVTNAQYAEFLNAKAVVDPLGLYNPAMTDGPSAGIIRTGSAGSYMYAPILGRESMPANYVSFYDALRFANWMNNGQGSGDTETGAYTLLGGTATPSNGTTVTRNAGATIFITSADEWYKAAYSNAASTAYFSFPTGSSTLPTCTTPTATPNRANCGRVILDLTAVGSYSGSPSQLGTFDQGGNAAEWNEESFFDGGNRGVRGSSFNDGGAIEMGKTNESARHPTFESGTVGFRVAMLPEPGGGVPLLASVAGMLGFAGWRRVSA